MDERPTIFVVDDDQDMLRLIAAALRGEGFIVQTFADSRAFLSQFRPGQRGCILLDVEMPGLGGLELQKELPSRQIDLPIVFLTATADVSTAVKAMKHGALDLLQKPFEVKTLVAAVRRAVEQDAQRSSETRRYQEVCRRRDRLTPREREVMDLVALGLSNKQVGVQLKVSPKTVEIHRGRVMRKMEADSVADLVRQSVELAKVNRPK